MNSENLNQTDSKVLSTEENDLENARSKNEKSETIDEFENPTNFRHIKMNRSEENTSSSSNQESGKHIKENNSSSDPLPKSATASCASSKEVTFDTNIPLWKKKRSAPDSLDTALHIENINVVLPGNDENRSNTHGSHYTESTTPMTASSTPTNIFFNQEPSEKGGKSKTKSAGTNVSTSIISKYQKPIFLFLIAYATIATGSGAYMFRQFFRIPGLDSQIDKLRAQNDILKGQIDRLEDQNEVLKLNIDRLQVNNAELKESNIVFKGLVDDLEQLNEEVDQINVVLVEQNNEYKENNQVMKENNIFLYSQVNETNKIAANLTAQVALYDSLIIEMEDEINRTEIIAAELDLLATNLTAQISLFEKENDRLSNITNDLRIVVSFLNDTSGNFVETYELMSNFLAEQITGYRTIRMSNHKIVYKQIITDWDCAVLTRFRLRDFAKDYDTPIGEISIDDVLTYVDERVLSEVCIERVDFEKFLKSTILQSGEQLSDLTVADLETGVSMYTTDLFDFYFPDAGTSGGLIESDWSQAQYDCSKLTKKFVY